MPVGFVRDEVVRARLQRTTAFDCPSRNTIDAWQALVFRKYVSAAGFAEMTQHI